MRTNYHISAAVLALVALASCNNEGLEEQVPEHGYIFFNTEVDSRGALIEDRLEDNFGVLGYYYGSTWDAAKAQARPNVFATYNQQVTWNGTAHTYSPQQSWKSGQKYSFFAYYPYGNAKVSPSAATHEGNPYITYTLASRSDATALVDVMTSQVIDTDATHPYVDFVMKHRLTAIDVVARNFNEQGQNVNITGMSIEFENLLFDNVRIPLNYTDEPDLVYETLPTQNTGAASYPLHSGSTIVVPPSQEDSEDTRITTSVNKTTMVVIPQNRFYDLDKNGTINETTEDCALKGKIYLSYSIGDTTKPNESLDFQINKDLKSGRRYYIQLTFTTSGITIAVVESVEWSDENIYHEFE